MTLWILILIIQNGTSATTQTFRSKESCERVAVELNTNRTYAKCFEDKPGRRTAQQAVDGVEPCGNHDPGYFGSRGCYVIKEEESNK